MRPGATFGERLELLQRQPLPFFDEELPSLPPHRLVHLGDRGDEEWVALVDERDADWAAQWPWFVLASGYAVRTRRKDDPPGPHLVYLHRAIHMRATGEDLELLVDHRNGCTLDCRRVNLRWATPAQNRANFYGIAWSTDLLWS